ncbi:phenylalanine N-monooxygenase-like [Hibiscus syriacus]|uniref:Phenylalanine N-monooxygenase-like n=1 Tax=Hibiscus syriacus TaxID=106335 RepID=A0A6A3CB21_HIBSY|nr:phenylalanine N-monooxygenase-like [Hibiscus syriacus]
MEVLSSIKDPFFIFNPQFISTILGASLALFIFFKLIIVSPPPATRNLAPGSLGYPLIGETISFVKAQKQDQTQRWILSRVENYGPVFKTPILWSKMVIVTGRAVNRFVFGGGYNGLSSNQPASVVKLLGKNSLFEMSGSRHKLVRGAIVGFLRPENIQRFAAKMDSLVQHQLLKLSEIVISRKKQEDEGAVEPTDDNIVSCLLALRDENGQPLSEDEIVDVFLSLIMASHDTTAALLTLFIRHLSRDAEVSNKVLQEQNEVLKAIKRNGGKLTWNEIQMMRYTWRAAEELMRVSPPMLGSFRFVTKDITFATNILGGAGTHMDSNIFEDPEKFDPSRFEGSSKAFHPYTYVPFGAGSRVCAGIEFAGVESLLIIHHPVTKYSWTKMIPDEPIIRSPMPYPAMGLPAKLYPKIED